MGFTTEWSSRVTEWNLRANSLSLAEHYVGAVPGVASYPITAFHNDLKSCWPRTRSVRAAYEHFINEDRTLG